MYSAQVWQSRLQKEPPKLKTPETEASGVSILITRSTTGVASSSSPSGRPPAFAGAVSSGCAGTEPPTCVDGLHSGSTGGQPSGSDRFRVLGSTGGKPPTCVDCSAHPLDLWRSFRLAPDDPGFIGLAPDNPGSIRLAPYGPSSGKADDLPPIRIDAVLWLGWRLHPACALCCPCPSTGSASSLHRLLHPSPLPAVNLSACASWLLLRLSL
jgi:hypothetical protein